ncbi:MAG: AarF/UbiB family protein [Polyangiaceae bacterium]
MTRRSATLQPGHETRRTATSLRAHVTQCDDEPRADLPQGSATEIQAGDEAAEAPPQRPARVASAEKAAEAIPQPPSHVASATAAPPRGLFARGSILGKAVVSASATRVGLALTQPFRDERGKAVAAVKAEEDMAKTLFEACGVLRGTALKLAQLLATEPELIPEAYRAEFARACHRAPPIGKALVRKLVTREIGVPEARFASFEDVPFAAASFGQVHAATSFEGEDLAVKLQYPGMKESVHTDLLALRTILRSAPQGDVFMPCVEEMRTRLSEELDYDREAEQTNWFREHLRLANVIVPQVHSTHSTRHVLTTERLLGLHLTEWLRRCPSENERNRYGQLLVSLFYHCLFDLGVIHADPNFGNYLFQSDGSLGLLDFGCIRRLSKEQVEAFYDLTDPNHTSSEPIEVTHARLGIRYRTNMPRRERENFLKDWGDWLREPFRTPHFDFSRAEPYFEQGARLARLSHRFLEHYDGSFLYVGRAHQGLLRFLQVLGARVQMIRNA